MISDAIGSIESDIGQGRKPPGTSVARWLSLAATPTFAVMALLTAASGGGMPDGLCSAAGSPLTGMFSMYLLMSIFHLAPWLGVLSSRRKLSPSSA